MHHVRRGFIAVALVSGLLSAGNRQPAAAEELDTPEVATLVALLDAPTYDVRQKALTELRACLDAPARRAATVLHLQTALAQGDLSLEVRDTLAGLVAGLPAPAELLPPVDPARAEALLAELGDARFVVRMQAADALRRLARQPGQAGRLLSELKRLQDGAPSIDLQASAARLAADVRRAWLSSDPAAWAPLPLAEAQVAAWLEEIIEQAGKEPAEEEHPDPLAGMRQPVIIVGNGFNALTIDRPGGFVRGEPWAFDLLATATDPPSARWPRQIALREFVDAAFHDANAPQLLAAVQTALADDQGLSAAARQRLEQLEELLLPTLVAEMWKERTLVTVQFLFLDVPQFPEYAVRATHFDSIDDETAHCVSGNSLLPGAYPVDRAIAPTHPDRDPNNPEDRMCIRLLNLETPRRRMKYFYDLQRPSQDRLRELSERSCAAWLAAERLLTEREAVALLQLEPGVVSRFVGPYLQAVADAPLPDDQELAVLGRTSSHALTCYVAAIVGDYEALEGMRAALAEGRIRPPGPTALYDLGWIAALELAGRASCPDAEAERALDAWLVELIADETPLMPGGGQSGPELGATAAGVLLRRHGQEPAEFDLGETPVAPALGLGLGFYRFLLPGGRDRIRTWWEQRQSELARAR